MAVYKLGIYKHFDFLVLINHYYLKDLELGENVRNFTEQELRQFDQKISIFFDQIAYENNLDKIIELILNLTGYLWLMQPFYDANTRTLNRFIKLYFKQLNYHLEYCDTNHTFIPLFYEEDEKCIPRDIQKLKLELIKSESKN